MKPLSRITPAMRESSRWNNSSAQALPSERPITMSGSFVRAATASRIAGASEIIVRSVGRPVLAP